MDKIWYVAYGSNINKDRLLKYIDGGLYNVTKKAHFGSTDTTKPSKIAIGHIDKRVYFAKNSPSWEGQAVAFINHISEPQIRSKCVYYLVSKRQFLDIYLQENGLNPKDASNKGLIDSIRIEDNFMLGSPEQFTFYGRMVSLGEKEGIPCYSFTAKEPFEYNTPGKEYVHVIGQGLKQRFNLNSKQAAFYLMGLDGIKNSTWTPNDLKELLNTLRVNKTLKRLNPKGHFLAQLHPKDKRKLRIRSFFQPFIIVQNKVNNALEVENFEVLARVKELSDKEQNIGDIRLDQTIRDAIGVDLGGRVTIAKKPFDWKSFWDEHSIFRFKKQSTILRVLHAVPNDMEIEICRIDNFALKSIGVEEGDKVIIETPNRRLSIRALILEEELKKSRQKEIVKFEGEDGEKKFASKLSPQLDLHKFNYLPKFKPANHELSSNHDLSWIFIDYDARVKLGIKLGDPVMVYRDNRFAISKRIESITIPLLLAFFGVGLNFKRINNYLQLSAELTLILEISFYVLIPLVIIWINLAPLRKSH